MTKIKFQNVDESRVIQFNFTDLRDGILLIRKDHFFDHDGERNDYFNENPGERNLGRMISVDGEFQQWNGIEWVTQYGIATGHQGDPGPQPKHTWHENYPTRVAFENPDGSWGEFVDLRGPRGTQGRPPRHGWDGSSLRFEQADGSWGDYVNLKGDKGDKGESGQSFKVDKTGSINSRENYDSEEEGFSFLATDEGKLYFREGSEGNWSDPVPFQDEKQLRRKAFVYSLIFG